MIKLPNGKLLNPSVVSFISESVSEQKTSKYEKDILGDSAWPVRFSFCYGIVGSDKTICIDFKTMEEAEKERKNIYDSVNKHLNSQDEIMNELRRIRLSVSRT